MWSVLEPALGIIAGCIATLRPLFKNFGLSGLKRPKKYNSSSNKKQSRSGGSSNGGGVGGGGASRRLTRPSNGYHYQNRNMLRLDDDDDENDELVVDDEDHDGRELDLELSPTNRSKTGVAATTKTTTAVTAADLPDSSADAYRPDTRGSETKPNSPCSPTFLNNNNSSSSRIYDTVEAFGNSGDDQRWGIESVQQPSRAHHVEPSAADGINVYTSFDVSSSPSQQQKKRQHQQQHCMTAYAETASNTSSSSRDLPLQGSALSPPPPVASVSTTTRHC